MLTEPVVSLTSTMATTYRRYQISFVNITSQTKHFTKDPAKLFQINGELTLGENIADNGGLREAFHAYQLYKDSFGREQKLPGFDDYTHEQLFFISFGNVCLKLFMNTSNF